MVERCPHCGLTFERIEGHWIGGVGINTIVSFGAILVTVVAGFVISGGQPDPVVLSVITLAVAIVVPLAFYPMSKTLWTAIDVLMRPVNPGELDPGYRIRRSPPTIPPADAPDN